MEEVKAEHSEFASQSPAARRLLWFAEYEKEKNVPAVCKKFSISRKTFYKWLKRYKNANGSAESLADQSRRPHTSPRATPKEIIDRLCELRKKTGFGQRRLQLYLSIWYDMELSESTIWKLLKKSGVDMSEKKKLRRRIKPDDPLLPGDRVLMFVKFIQGAEEKQIYAQYTAIDECTRLRIAKIYGRHSTLSALDFVQILLMEFPFLVHHLHTPLDNVFTSVSMPGLQTHAFTRNLRKLGIRHDLPTRRQLAKGKFKDRIARFDEVEPYSTKKFSSPEELQARVAKFLFQYNNYRPIPFIENLTPVEKLQTYENFNHIRVFDPYHQH
ncbi:MAG: helix-turn-helix domain-containing protein [Bacteroidota bacterium]|nr:helix-turn-helix domain-containing protein [Bacteroidota bacterium]